MMMIENNSNTVAVTKKYNRCLSFTLPTGEVIECKVIGEKDAAAVSSTRLLQALKAAGTGLLVR